MKMIFCCALSLGVAVGCVSHDPTVARVPDEAVDERPVVTQEKVIVSPSIVRDREDVSEEKTSGNDLRYVGMESRAAQKLAKAQGLKSRVAREDGEPRMLTRDYRPDRLNFTVVKGRVTRVTRG